MLNIVRVTQNWKSRSRGNFVMRGERTAFSFPCALGRNGLTALKREGDGATPLGRYRMLWAYYRKDRRPRPQTRLPLYEITPDMGWCDAPNDRNYNKNIELPYSASHENMMRSDHLYDLVVVLDYNITRRMRNAGSAIFFHLARGDFEPTEGCIAVHENVMRLFLRLATPGTEFLIER